MKTLLKDLQSNRPLLIQPAKAVSFLQRLTAVPPFASGAKVSDMGEMLQAMFGEVKVYEKFPPFAFIPIHGVIGKNLSDLEKMCGCCDIEDVEEMLEDAVKDSTITTIVFEIDSPGGCSVGVPELANRIKSCAKNTIAFTDNEACSAAYWLGSQAKAFYATPSSTVGSIGVYIAYPDESAAYEEAGVKMDVIKAGIYKGAGIPGTSLDDKQRAMLQSEVLEIFGEFKSAVKGVREFVEDDSMEGQTFSGRKGAEAGLVTGLVMGFDEMMQTLNAEVALQMEADEENDKRHGDELIGEEISKHEAKVRTPAGLRALADVNLSAKSEAKKSEEDEEDEEDESTEAEAGKLPAKMEEGEDDDDDDGDDEEGHAPEAKHHVIVSDYMETIKKHDDSEDEEANEAVLRHLKKMNKSGRKIHIVSGRPESKRSEVADFLAKHKVEHHALHLKPEDDKRSTPEYKVEALKKIEAEGHKVSHIVENDKDCAEAYEEAGYHCVHPDTVERMDSESEAEDAVETDEKHDKKKLPRHKSRGVA